MNTPVRRVVGALVAAALAASTAACTGGDGEPSATPSAPTSTGAEATVTARPAPLRVQVTRVSGRLAPRDRRALEHNVGIVVGRYVEGAFLGDYPRSDFGAAFTGFDRGVRKDAVRDQDLLTNSRFGPTATAVTVRERSAYLSVLAPHKVAAGVTARLTVRLTVDRGDLPGREVTVRGRLLLTRKKSGGWQIFGYDLARSVRAEEGS